MTAAMAACACLALGSLPSAAQVPVDTVAQQGIPAGYTFAPRVPSGFFNLGNDVWFGDEAQGFHHYKPIDPTDPTPLETQQYQFDTDPTWSVGGGGACIPYCSVGQVAKRTDVEAIVASWDHQKGQPGQVGGGGVYRQFFSSATIVGNTGSPLGGGMLLAPTKLPGNQPTAVAWGPDGKVYVGFLKSPSYVRITGIDMDQTLQTVESVGTALNGKPVFAMAFYGSDLYMGTGDGFYVVPNIVSCFGNANNCGAPKLLLGLGPVNAVVADNLGRLYFAVNSGGFVMRYTPATAVVETIASGFKFAAGHTNGLGIDRDGNLWIGDNPAPEGTPNGGRLSRILAANLAPLQ
jgi:hypothetical protein